MYKSKSKVNLPVDVLQSPRCKTWPLNEELHNRHFRDESVSGLFSFVFVYKPALKMGDTTFELHRCIAASCYSHFVLRRL